MPTPPTARPPAGRAPLAAAGAALLAAGSAFVLPAWDAVLPGGALLWQGGAIVVALGLAVWSRRRASRDGAPRDGGGWTGARRSRWLAAAALLLALAWLGGVAVLWLWWPH